MAATTPHKGKFSKDAFVTAACIFFIALLCSVLMAEAAVHGMTDQIRMRLRGVATTAAILTDGSLHETLTKPRQKNSPAYRQVQAPYRKILAANPDLRYIYTMIVRHDKWYLIIDTQPEDIATDPNITRKTTADIMEEYPEVTPAMWDAYNGRKAVAEKEVGADSWGTFLSAYAPIYNSKHRFIGLVGVDINAATFKEGLSRIWCAFTVSVALALLLSIAAYFGVITMYRHCLEKEAADNASEAKTRFLSNVSHEMRTPLHAILNYSAMGLKALAASPDETLKKYYNNIHISGERLVSLLNNLLDLGKLESGKADVNLTPGNIHDALEQSLAEIGSLITRKNLQVKITGEDIAAEKPVAHDKNMIVQVFINLLSNAIKFSPADGLIDVVYSRDPDGLRISIGNEGPGIPAEDLETIFDPFTQSSATKGRANGTGLGLAICHEIATLHHGKIWAEARPMGAVFHLVLPVTG